jgi:RNA polymerase sigma factor (sigma-70 family)
MEDDELPMRVRAAAAGDQQAWSWLVDRFSRLVWSVIRANGLSESDAADAYQLTWLRLLDRIGTVQDPSRLGGWLATTARNECRGIWRKSGRAMPMDDEGLDRVSGTAPSADVSSVTASRDETLWDAFNRLTSRCQRVLRVLVADAEEGPPEYAGAALVLQMPVGSLGPTRRRCLDQLRRMLPADGI